MVDLGGREPGDLYRRVQQDQFLKLNLQRIEIPLPLFGEAVDGKPQDTLFVWIQMLNAHARDSIEAQLLGCRVARFAVMSSLPRAIRSGSQKPRRLIEDATSLI